jgi:hypothetical protein
MWRSPEDLNQKMEAIFSSDKFAFYPTTGKKRLNT